VPSEDRVLVLKDVSKRFGDVVALDGATFEARPGRILGFLGPNGAGKTTAMRCIFGLSRPDSGSIEWNGQPISGDQRLRFGYMPEERGLYPKMKVREELVHFAHLSGLGSGSEDAADQWLRRLGLAGRAHSRVEQLSHGNQQRLQVAVALVHDPELLVLDEPFAGLDPLGTESLAGVLHELAEGGVAVIFSSHQLDLVEDICEDVAIIDHGKVVLTGDLDDLRSAAQVRRLEVVVDGDPWLDGPEPLRMVRDDGRVHYLVDKGIDLGAILSAAERAGRLDRFSYEPPRLSELFREAVRR
jgi:ABC-2 type transport system ATP-binding protein